ncbi:ComF family protein [bacterium]|nr:ComF family protein [bacterium]
MNIFNYFLDSKCIICKKSSENRVCQSCIDKIDFFPKNLYFERTDFYFEKIFSLFPYNNIVSNLIHSYKFNDYRSLSKLFGSWLVEYFSETVENYDYILPVPLHVKKERVRGFNQTDLILKAAGWDKKIFKNIKKDIETKQQSLMKNSFDRVKNSENAFKISESAVELVKNHSFLIFDDITTTGATANEIAKHLYFCNASKIDLMVLSLA